MALSEYGWHDRVAALFGSSTASGVPARVIRPDRGSCMVATEAGVVRANPYALASRRAGLTVTPATGDWVVVTEDRDEGWVVVEVLPRWSTISRKESDERAVAEQVIAANVDVMAAVCSLDRPFAENRLERMLAVAWDSGASPVVVLTKSDLASDVAGLEAAAAVVAGGSDVYVTSATSGAGVDALRARVRPDRTLCFVGPSGAGKSSLVNRLVGANVQATGDVRMLDQRGRHTTTTRDLIPLPGGGVLIDTPGLRSLPLWNAGEGVALTFDDIEELAEQCRFSDCNHETEPGCAVTAALRDGTLDQRRFDSWRKLESELAALALRQDEHARRAAARNFQKEVKQHTKARPDRPR